MISESISNKEDLDIRVSSINLFILCFYYAFSHFHVAINRVNTYNRIITILPFLPNVDLTILRSIRVLRPLKLVSGIPSK